MKRLLIRPGAIGDFILSLPALEFLKTDDTEVWCAEANVPLAGFADRAVSIGASGIDHVGVLPDPAVLTKLRAFDEIHSWYGTARADFRAAVRHLPFCFYDALPPTQTTPEAGLRETRWHATAFYCRQTGALCTLPQLRGLGARHPSAVTVIHPFASSARKRWDLARFRGVAAHIERGGGPTAWCAGPEEALEGAVRIADLNELAHWLAGARLYIGNDSGITHLAAAVGTPVIALFGPTDPDIWAPRGPNVRVIHRHPIQAIDPADVFDAMATLL